MFTGKPCARSDLLLFVVVDDEDASEMSSFVLVRPFRVCKRSVLFLWMLLLLLLSSSLASVLVAHERSDKNNLTDDVASTTQKNANNLADNLLLFRPTSEGVDQQHDGFRIIDTQDKSSGLTLRVYNNTALHGAPSCTCTVKEPLVLNISDCCVDGNDQNSNNWFHDNEAESSDNDDRDTDTFNDKPCSAELTGTVRFHSVGLYNFTCQFASTSTAWVWVDGHLVCHDGHVYGPLQPGSHDNPLTIRSTNRSLAFRAHLTNNLTCNGGRRNYYDCSPPPPPRFGLSVSWEYSQKNVSNSSSSNNFRNLDSDSFGDKGRVLSLFPELPVNEQRRDDMQRSMVAAAGWGNWLHHDMLSVVQLPTGRTVSVRVCRRSTGKCWNRATADGYDVHTRVGLHAIDNSYAQTYAGPAPAAGIHVNVSVEYASVRAAARQLQDEQQEGEDQEKDHHLELLITPVACGFTGGGGAGGGNREHDDCSDYVVQIEGRHAWFRAGTVRRSNGTTREHRRRRLPSLIYDSPGFETTRVSCSSHDKDVADSRDGSRNAFCGCWGDNHGDGSNNTVASTLILPLKKTGQAVGVSTRRSSLTEIRRLLNAKREKEKTRLIGRFGKDGVSVATAIQAAVTWTAVYTPVENNAVILPVSRRWSCTHGTATTDWTYCIFDWDNFFASLLAAAVDHKRLAYSNLFQVVKSKTAAGFVPNYAAGGSKSQDRTEPVVGAAVTLALYRKYRDDWMVSVVFDDLLDWHRWFVRNRVLQPAGLLAVGSWNEQSELQHIVPQQGHSPNTMQAARWESGLDNSPMYDGNFFDNTTTHCMQLYDVGMSSLFVQDAYALAELAEIAGKSKQLIDELKASAAAVSAKISQYLWDPAGQIYTNRFPNGTFYRRISPTSFYSMAAGAATLEQAAFMTNNWLTNSSKFCISLAGDFHGNDVNGCYWGLPSISSDDPAFAALGYWRGYVWGPMALLTYWSLNHQRYNRTPAVRRARKALCQQMRTMFLHYWDAKRHVCENYSPHKDAADCTGTNFYHWGALTGLIGLMEDGHFYNNTSAGRCRDCPDDSRPNGAAVS